MSIHADNPGKETCHQQKHTSSLQPLITMVLLLPNVCQIVCVCGWLFSWTWFPNACCSGYHKNTVLHQLSASQGIPNLSHCLISSQPIAWSSLDCQSFPMSGKTHVVVTIHDPNYGTLEQHVLSFSLHRRVYMKIWNLNVKVELTKEWLTEFSQGLKWWKSSELDQFCDLSTFLHSEGFLCLL